MQNTHRPGQQVRRRIHKAAFPTSQVAHFHRLIECHVPQRIWMASFRAVPVQDFPRDFLSFDTTPTQVLALSIELAARAAINIHSYHDHTLPLVTVLTHLGTVTRIRSRTASATPPFCLWAGQSGRGLLYCSCNYIVAEIVESFPPSLS
jgi:hypothetical protein